MMISAAKGWFQDLLKMKIRRNNLDEKNITDEARDDISSNGDKSETSHNSKVIKADKTSDIAHYLSSTTTLNTDICYNLDLLV